MKFELLKDGTLVIDIPIDMSKVKRVLVTDENSQFGDLFYTDDEVESGLTKPTKKEVLATLNELLNDNGVCDPYDPMRFALSEAIKAVEKNE